MPEFEDVALVDAEFGNIRKNSTRDMLNGATVKVGGTKYVIGIKNRVLERFKVSGQTDFFNSTILLESNLTEGNTLLTLLHEIIECISRQYYLDLPHDLINTFETHLFDVLTDNPLILEELLKYARKLGNDKSTKESKKNKK